MQRAKTPTKTLTLNPNCLCIFIYVCVCVSVYVCLFVYICVCVCVSMCLYVRVCKFIISMTMSMKVLFSDIKWTTLLCNFIFTYFRFQKCMPWHILESIYVVVLMLWYDKLRKIFGIHGLTQVYVVPQYTYIHTTHILIWSWKQR